MEENNIIEQISQAVIDGDDAASAEKTRLALASGADPMLILNAGLMAGAEVVGKRFEQGEYFLPELLLTARALKSAMDVIKPALLEQQSRGVGRVSGKIIVATIQTDIHDIGKNIVASLLTASGYDVTDMGVDVPLKSIVDKAEEIGADVIAVSSLLTTSMPYMKDLIELLKGRGVRGKYKVLVGGASVTKSWAESIGADGTASNAADAVVLVRSLLGSG
ncbi:MAG: cobalamin B12-binding domain-containing protein [Anaerolineales bacterium]